MSSAENSSLVRSGDTLYNIIILRYIISVSKQKRVSALKTRVEKSMVRNVKIAANSVKYGYFQAVNSIPRIYPSVSFKLKLTSELERLAEKVDKTADGTQEYVFYAGINGFTESKTDNHLRLIVYNDDGDEDMYMVELKEDAKKALYGRLDEQCQKKLGKSCETLLKEAERRMKA